jgi:hypothetical protein
VSDHAFFHPLPAHPGRALFARVAAGPWLWEENVTLQFSGSSLSVGDNVFFNRNVFLDTKGGVEIGDSGRGRDVRVFTHGNGEAFAHDPDVCAGSNRVLCQDLRRGHDHARVTVGEQPSWASGRW